MRCLLVDDHESVRAGVTAILSSRTNIEVCGEASDGREAVEKARELLPDLIILDVTMPVMDGINSAKEIRSFLPDVPTDERAQIIGAHGRGCDEPRGFEQRGVLHERRARQLGQVAARRE